MREAFLPFSPPAIGEEEIQAVTEALRGGWLTLGPRVREFEDAFSKQVGAQAALAVSSCTAALHLALVTLGLKPGDEVVTTPFTFAATANVIEHVGAHPVFADVEADTLNLDSDAVERVISSRTRAILPVHFAGHPVEMDRFQDLAERHGLELVFDAAHALPAEYRGHPIGSEKHFSAFSFYATKNLTTGEGGMLTGDEARIARARPLALHGMNRDAWKRYHQGGSWFYEIEAAGFKCNLTDPQAAMGLVQLKKLEAFQKRRDAVSQAYDRAFRECPALEPMKVREGIRHARHLYPLRLRTERLSISRDSFLEALGQRRIGASVHFIPLHLHPFYRDRYGLRPEDFPQADDAYRRILSLPLHPGLSDADVSDVIEAVLDIVCQHGA
jgi:dTDP-4-amino-4,6-dideoxygalactose transaminase